MRENAQDFIYLNTQSYIGLRDLKVFYWSTFIFQVFLFVLGSTGKTIMPMVSSIIWSFLYWMFVLVLQSKFVKKTFELRFLVNGVAGVFFVAIWWLFFASFSLVADKFVFEFDLFLWLLPLYLLFTIVYLFLLSYGVRKGIWRKVREKSQSPMAIWLTGICTSLIPISGIIGIYTARLMKTQASTSEREFMLAITCVSVFFLLGLTNIQFLQYYYCKRWNITCDEAGNKTSPKLESTALNVKKVRNGTNYN